MSGVSKVDIIRIERIRETTKGGRNIQQRLVGRELSGEEAQERVKWRRLIDRT